MVCGRETFRSTSEWIEETQATNALFVVVRSVDSATMDMGVGYAGLEKFFDILDMPVMTRKTFLKHQMSSVMQACVL